MHAPHPKSDVVNAVGFGAVKVPSSFVDVESVANVHTCSILDYFQVAIAVVAGIEVVFFVPAQRVVDQKHIEIAIGIKVGKVRLGQ